jgi:hypothetical protein
VVLGFFPGNKFGAWVPQPILGLLFPEEWNVYCKGVRVNVEDLIRTDGFVFDATRELARLHA